MTQSKERIIDLLIWTLALMVIAGLLGFALLLSQFEIGTLYCPVESACYDTEPAFSGPIYKTRQGRLIEAYPNSHPKPPELAEPLKLQHLLGNSP